jgi:hypothetical protein
LQEAIKEKALLSCSDGAYCPQTGKGSHSWIFGSPEQLSIMAGAGPTDGHPSSMSSYRAELGGIVAALYVIHRICDYYSITMGKATLYCDNKGAINNRFQTITPGLSQFLSPSYDLLLLAKQLVTSMTWRISWQAIISLLKIATMVQTRPSYHTQVIKSGY